MLIFTFENFTILLNIMKIQYYLSSNSLNRTLRETRDLTSRRSLYYVKKYLDCYIILVLCVYNMLIVGLSMTYMNILKK